MHAARVMAVPARAFQAVGILFVHASLELLKSGVAVAPSGRLGNGVHVTDSRLAKQRSKIKHVFAEVDSKREKRGSNFQTVYAHVLAGVIWCVVWNA